MDKGTSGHRNAQFVHRVYDNAARIDGVRGHGGLRDRKAPLEAFKAYDVLFPDRNDDPYPYDLNTFVRTVFTVEIEQHAYRNNHPVYHVLASDHDLHHGGFLRGNTQ